MANRNTTGASRDGEPTPQREPEGLRFPELIPNRDSLSPTALLEAVHANIKSKVELVQALSRAIGKRGEGALSHRVDQDLERLLREYQDKFPGKQAAFGAWNSNHFEQQNLMAELSSMEGEPRENRRQDLLALLPIATEIEQDPDLAFYAACRRAVNRALEDNRELAKLDFDENRATRAFFELLHSMDEIPGVDWTSFKDAVISVDFSNCECFLVLDAKFSATHNIRGHYGGMPFIALPNRPSADLTSELLYTAITRRENDPSMPPIGTNLSNLDYKVDVYREAIEDGDSELAARFAQLIREAADPDEIVDGLRPELQAFLRIEDPEEYLTSCAIPHFGDTTPLPLAKFLHAAGEECSFLHMKLEAMRDNDPEGIVEPTIHALTRSRSKLDKVARNFEQAAYVAYRIGEKAQRDLQTLARILKPSQYRHASRYLEREYGPQAEEINRVATALQGFRFEPNKVTTLLELRDAMTPQEKDILKQIFQVDKDIPTAVLRTEFGTPDLPKEMVYQQQLQELCQFLDVGQRATDRLLDSFLRHLARR